MRVFLFGFALCSSKLAGYDLDPGSEGIIQNYWPWEAILSAFEATRSILNLRKPELLCVKHQMLTFMWKWVGPTIGWRRLCLWRWGQSISTFHSLFGATFRSYWAFTWTFDPRRYQSWWWLFLWLLITHSLVRWHRLLIHGYAHLLLTNHILVFQLCNVYFAGLTFRFENSILKPIWNKFSSCVLYFESNGEGKIRGILDSSQKPK